jgi:nucleoside-diphosphate-sugar epimerase
MPPSGHRLAFVTGATGLLGSNLVRLLLADGWRVRALVRSAGKARTQFGTRPLELVTGDMRDVGAFAPALAGVDAVFHTAAYFRESYRGGNHRRVLEEVNVRGTAALLDAAHAAGVRRVVHTSSIATLDGPPGCLVDETMRRRDADADDYARSKLLADAEVEARLRAHPDLWAAFVLPGWIHGPGDIGPTSAGQVVLDFVKGKLPGLVPGTVALVDARDVAAAMVAAERRGGRGERYLAAGHHLDMRDLMALLERVTGVPAPRRTIPLTLLWPAALASEAWARVTGRPVLLGLATVRLVAREAERTRFDHARSARELGLAFRPVEETLRDEVAWYRANGWLPEHGVAR